MTNSKPLEIAIEDEESVVDAAITEFLKSRDTELQTALSSRQHKVIHQVPLCLLKTSPLLVERKHSDKQIMELAESVKTKGLIHKPLCTIWSNDIIIICGNCRVKAANKALLESIDIELVACNVNEAYELLIAENLEREVFNHIEEAEFYAGWKKNASVTDEYIAKEINRSLSHVKSKLRLLQLPPEIQELIRQARLPYSFGLLLLQIKDKGQQIKLAETAIANGFTYDELKDKIAQTKVDKEIEEIEKSVMSEAANVEVVNPQTKPLDPAEMFGELDFLKQITQKCSAASVELALNLK